MIKKVQFKFWLLAMASMGLCVIALIVVINVIHAAQTEREIDRALGEMVATVESLRDDQARRRVEEPEWRVESYVEEEPVDTPAPTPEQTQAPEVTQQPENTPEDVYTLGPKGGRGGKKWPWWYEEFLWEESQEQETEAAATPSPEIQETVVNHYYFYYPTETDEELDLRSSAMNQYAGRLCMVHFTEGEDPVVGMSDSNALEESENRKGSWKTTAIRSKRTTAYGSIFWTAPQSTRPGALCCWRPFWWGWRGLCSRACSSTSCPSAPLSP